jgi:hypothetical protein
MKNKMNCQIMAMIIRAIFFIAVLFIVSLRDIEPPSNYDCTVEPPHVNLINLLMRAPNILEMLQ